MRASMQEKFKPFVGRNGTGAGSDNGPAKILSADSSVSFKDVLMASNLEVSKERAASKNGDLSAAKTDEDFFRILNDRNNPDRGPKNQLDKDDFLKLFIAQLQNQDPLKPEDSAQMAAQLAQFNGLEQMLNVNKTLTEILKGQNNGRNFGMLDYVGREVTIEGGRSHVAGGQVSDLTFNVDRSINNATLEVRNESGAIVATEELGELRAGEQDLSWSKVGSDGKPLRDGVYTFSVTATGEEGQPVPVPVQTRVMVTGVDLKDPAGAFMTPVGRISAKDVVAVRIPGEKNLEKTAVKPPEKKPQDPVRGGGSPQESSESGESPANAEESVQMLEIPVPPMGSVMSSANSNNDQENNQRSNDANS